MIKRDILMKGFRFRKKVHVTAYDDEVEIRPLLETEVTEIVRHLEEEGLKSTEVQEIMSTNYRMLYWACQYAIVNKDITDPLPAKMQAEMRKKLADGNPDPLDTHIYTGVDLLIGGAVREIGGEIIRISSGESQELVDFFKGLKPKEAT